MRLRNFMGFEDQSIRSKTKQDDGGVSNYSKKNINLPLAGNNMSMSTRAFRNIRAQKDEVDSEEEEEEVMQHAE